MLKRNERDWNMMVNARALEWYKNEMADDKGVIGYADLIVSIRAYLSQTETLHR